MVSRCSSSASIVIIVLKGRYLLHSMAFKGALDDYRILGQFENWFNFEGATGVSIVGGALDTEGAALWACKAFGKGCPSGATIRVKIIVDGNSPNTDGIHVHLSRNVAIINMSIRIRMCPLALAPRTCGSNASYAVLAMALGEHWKSNKGLGRGRGPKCDSNKGNFYRVTSAISVAIKFDCSATNPCPGIRLEDVQLTYKKQEAQSSCVNANGKAFGIVQPNNCL
ncbi:hypothetical protein FEM48_Zijuj11G0134000 [Ziziphus jujuba var. spinosa]|uniref:Polygalacturonase-like n=1 Tax=Ziziphus jujuba var. spinosa TaxID=714518 RepID=A0A978UJ68_ZIZJJ|nr:hypothetical protein FEM48_Zijuj11G0134000 [Ziziphus jujuba var. spinosa]